MKFERALITGATSGIGEALAWLLASKDISLILTGRNFERLEKIGQQVKAESIFALDLQNKQQRQILVRVIQEKIPDLVINNAGFGLYGDIITIPVAEQLAILEVDGAAPLELTLEAARALIYARKKGMIVNVSSVAGEFPCPGMSVYGGVKAFLTNASQALNTETSSKGVDILVSCPGMVATDFARRASKKRIVVKTGPVLTAQFSAEQIWKQIEEKRKKYIFNWQYRIGSWVATYLLPVSIIKKFIWKRIKKRI